MTDEQKDVNIHIYEHIAPLKEQVGKMGAQIEHHDRELGDMKESVRCLDAKIDGVRDRLDVVSERISDSISTQFDKLTIMLEKQSDRFFQHVSHDEQKDAIILNKINDIEKRQVENDAKIEQRAKDAEKFERKSQATMRVWLIGIGILIALLTNAESVWSAISAVLMGTP